jgi:hypothetical protein
MAAMATPFFNFSYPSPFYPPAAAAQPVPPLLSAAAGLPAVSRPVYAPTAGLVEPGSPEGEETAIQVDSPPPQPRDDAATESQAAEAGFGSGILRTGVEKCLTSVQAWSLLEAGEGYCTEMPLFPPGPVLYYSPVLYYTVFYSPLMY